MNRKALSIAVFTALTTLAAVPGMAATTTDISNIIINEVLPDPNGSSNFDTDGDGVAETEDEFFEFYNKSTTDTVDLSGMEFWDNQQSYTFPSGSVIPPLGYLIIVGDWDSSEPQPACVVRYGRNGSTGFGNGGDVGVLYDPVTKNYIGAAYGGDSVDNDVDGDFQAITGKNKLYEIDFGNDTDGQSLSLSIDGDLTSSIVKLSPPTPVMNDNCGNADGTGKPIADAGDDQTISGVQTVTLDASESTDTDGGSISTYFWEQVGTPSVTISDVAAINPTFESPSVATDTELEFKVTVTDNDGNTASDIVIVTVQPAAIVCNSTTTQNSSSLGIPTNQWIMFGLPLDPGANNSIADIFDELPAAEYGSTWYIYEIDNATSSYTYLSSTASTLSQGKAYWVITLGSPVNVTMSGTNTSTDTACYAEVPLYNTSYNLYGETYDKPNAIGNPMNATVSWGDIQVKTDSSTYISTAQADTDEVMKDAFVRGPSGSGKHYEGGDVYTYAAPVDAGDILPWEAVWVTVEENAQSGMTKLAVPE